MEFINHNPKILILSGKAKSGKNLAANLIEEYYASKKCIQLSYAYYLKQYVKKITKWDGNENTKPRKLLQDLGIDLLKKQIDDKLLIRRICEDIKVYSYFYDIIIITDARLKDEIEIPLKMFKNVKTIRITRENFDNELSNEEKKHITETDLDNYDNFDYVIDSVDLKTNLYDVLKENDYDSCN